MAVESTGGGGVKVTEGITQATGGTVTNKAAGGEGTADLSTLEADQKALAEAGQGAALEGAPEGTEPAKPAEGTTEEKPEGSKPPEGSVRTVDEIKASLKEAGGFYADPRYEAAAIEFEQTGDVTDATVKATAEAFGVPEDMARTFIDSQKQLRQLQTAQAQTTQDTVVADLQAVAGGPAEYTKFQEWGNENLTQAQHEAFNKAADSDPKVAKALLEGFVARWKAEGNGAAPRDITQGGAPAGTSRASDGYASSAAMQKDMNDPRYANDSAFRAEVERKVGASRF